MFYVKNAVYKPITLAWDEITLPLKAGTPISLSGRIANNAAAVGIVPQTIDILPVIPEVNILVGGNVELAEVNESFGSELEDDARHAMSGIVFYGAAGIPDPNQTGGSEGGESGKLETWAKTRLVLRKGEIRNYLDVADQLPVNQSLLFTAAVEGSSLVSASVDSAVFEGRVGSDPGSHIFTFDGSSWTFDGTSVAMADYGITVTGTPEEGDTCTVTITASTFDYDVEGIDEEISVKGDDLHVLTLQMHKVFSLLLFDPAQYLVAVTQGLLDSLNISGSVLPAGTYNFTLDHGAYNAGTDEDGTYQFTTTVPVPIGGGIRHSTVGQSQTTYAKTNITGGKVTTYGSDTLTVLESDIAVTEGSSGTNLGTATAETYAYKSGEYINYTRRQRYGSGRWSTSYIRQVLNSDEAVVTFRPGTIFSRNLAVSPEGLRHALDPELAAVLTKVRKRYALNPADNAGVAGGYEDVEDYVTLDTMMDVFGGQNGSVYEGPVNNNGEVVRTVPMSLWKDVNTDNQSRIKYDENNTARYWWLGSMYPSYCCSARSVHTSGALYDYNARNSYGVVPRLHIA